MFLILYVERFQKAFYVPDGFLVGVERRRPRSPQYLEQNVFSRGEVMYKSPWFAALFDRLRSGEGRRAQNSKC